MDISKFLDQKILKSKKNRVSLKSGPEFFFV